MSDDCEDGHTSILLSQEDLPMLSSPRKPPEKTFLPEGSLRFTHLKRNKRDIVNQEIFIV